MSVITMSAIRPDFIFQFENIKHLNIKLSVTLTSHIFHLDTVFEHNSTDTNVDHFTKFYYLKKKKLRSEILFTIICTISPDEPKES